MHKSIIKFFIYFIILSAVIATILLCINLVGFASLYSDIDDDRATLRRQKDILEQISDQLSPTENGFVLQQDSIIPTDHFCILIDSSGEIIWEHNKPDDIPEHYSLNDVARMTRWFLNDYPVYVRTEDYGLLVLGQPKNAVGKYQITFSEQWFKTLPQRVLFLLILNLFLAAGLALAFGTKIYQQLKMLTKGIQNLQLEKDIQLRANGIFRELSDSINRTSSAIARKNAALAAKEDARLNWISGITHDIRTPLSIISGYSEALAQSADLTEDARHKAQTMLAQCMKVKKLVEDLNLISSLEYDMQPARKKEVRLCPLLRIIVSDIENNGLSDKYCINLNLRYEPAVVLCDEALMERAIFNLINNSITHNPNGCEITITEIRQDNKIFLKIADNGCGVPEDVLKKLSSITETKLTSAVFRNNSQKHHGIGLPMVFKIIYVHGGSIRCKNEKGFTVQIELPLYIK